VGAPLPYAARPPHAGDRCRRTMRGLPNSFFEGHMRERFLNASNTVVVQMQARKVSRRVFLLSHDVWEERRSRNHRG
jgi:hypothetical protein